ncbi:MAG: hypothetical protein KAS62_03495, partial [Candidatus Delongbacteria bacterium]|nr:hypothetical protein [Candidatus Delongbacteria bacterium]
MRLFIIYILLLMTINVWSQTELGIGLVSISYDENTILDLYINKADKEPEKKIIFFLDSTIKSWNIRDLEKQREW